MEKILILFQDIKAPLKVFIYEATLEFLRLVEFSVLPVFISSADLKTGVININWAIVYALLFVSFWKAIDKGLHGSGISEKGITRF